MTLFLHPFIIVNISGDRGKNNGINLSDKVTICIHVQDFPFVSSLLLPFVLDLGFLFEVFVCFGLLFFSSCCVIFLNMVHWKSFRDSSTFSHCTRDFLLQHLMIHMSKFHFFLSWGKQLLSFSVRY